ncbi:MAG: VOC family protein [Nitrospiria bacterium]
MPNRIVWFDLPVRDLNRAIQFYSEVLDAEIKEDFPGVAVIAHKKDAVSGCLFLSESQQPSKEGTLIYFNVQGRLAAAVDAVKKNGGQVEQPPHEMGPFGNRAIVIDSEGNRIALHSA